MLDYFRWKAIESEFALTIPELHHPARRSSHRRHLIGSESSELDCHTVCEARAAIRDIVAKTGSACRRGGARLLRRCLWNLNRIHGAVNRDRVTGHRAYHY